MVKCFRETFQSTEDESHFIKTITKTVSIFYTFFDEVIFTTQKLKIFQDTEQAMNKQAPKTNLQLNSFKKIPKFHFKY